MNRLDIPYLWIHYYIPFYSTSGDSLALSLLTLAVEAIIETPGAVALLVAFPVVEVPPALQRCRAVLPWVVEVERTVSAVPTAGMVVAQ